MSGASTRCWCDGVTARPRARSHAAAGLPAVLVLSLLASGCSHYGVGIPIAPGLSIGLGATKDGNFSVGLNTGFGPLGAGVAVNQGGVVAGSVGMGAGIGPAGVGVGQSVVLHDPNAVQSQAAPAGPATSASAYVGVGPLSTSVATPPAGIALAANAAPATPGVVVRRAGSVQPVAAARGPAPELGTPANPIAP